MAWPGRTSTDDQRDPTLSLPRQPRGCRDALPDGALIVAHFYDVESGRTNPAARGRDNAYEAFDGPGASSGPGSCCSGAYFRSCLAITMRWIWFVPS